MTEVENILIKMGELVYTEIDGVESVEYAEGQDTLTAFAVTMENGNRYSIEIKEKI